MSVGVNVVDGFVVAVDVDVLFTVAVVVVVGSVVVQIRLDVEFWYKLGYNKVCAGPQKNLFVIAVKIYAVNLSFETKKCLQFCSLYSNDFVITEFDNSTCIIFCVDDGIDLKLIKLKLLSLLE